MRAILTYCLLLGLINLLRAQSTDFTNCCTAQITSGNSDPCSTFEACCNSASVQYGCGEISTCGGFSCSLLTCKTPPPTCAPPPIPATTAAQPLWAPTTAQRLWAPTAVQSNSKNGAVKKVCQKFLTIAVTTILCQFLL
jgi:hypothetical protein